MYFSSSQASRLLPMPAMPSDRHEPRPPLAGRGVEQLLEQAQLVVAAHERGLEPGRPAVAAAPGHDPDGLPGGDRRGLALERLLAGRFVDDRRLGGRDRRLADEDRPRRRDRLEAATPC